MERQNNLPLTDLFASLTEAQRTAVAHIDGPMLTLAGPGSGKTRVVTHRVANLVRQGIQARNILALTFTNKAADEMRQRLAALAPGQPVWMGTFHRFCARMLRTHASLVGLSENFSIYDTDDSRKLLKLVLAEERLESSHASPDGIAHAISAAKNNLVTPDKYRETALYGSALGSLVERAYPAYQRALLRANAVDFDDLLQHVAVLLRENPHVRADQDARYKYILVDEYQDTNLAQYAIIRALSIDYPNLSVTGDPDQSIYGWRGANVRNILDFEQDFPNVKVVRLEQNYRSTKAILRVADVLIAHNKRRKKKRLWTENAEGQPVRLTCYPSHTDEAEQIAAQIGTAVRQGKYRPRDFAIFFRTNALSRQFEHALREQVIPYQIVNGLEFYQRMEIKDVMAYLHLLNNQRDNVALLRVINTPTRGIGKSTISKLQEYASRKGLSMLDAARQAGLVEGLPKKSAVAVAKFVALVDKLSASLTAEVEQIVGMVLSESGYREVLENSESEEDQERLANLEELLTAARQFDMHNPQGGMLEQFLEETSLVSDTDAWSSDTDRVSLMTMHAAKGLEFPVVFVVAAEQGLLPHERSRYDEDKLEEERRLLFVALTRARQELQISYAQYRMFRGVNAPTIPSHFLGELPRDEMTLQEPKSMLRRMIDPASQLPPEDDDFGDAEHFDDGPRDEKSDSEADISFDPEEFSQIEPPPARKKPELDKRFSLMSGTDFLSQQEESGPRFPPHVFKHGMHVLHPAHGLGTIIALGGEGPKRTATVHFSSDNRERRFFLIHAKLEPVESE
jgi:DNA helicase-2/ATP-dependent DNA helicase PcrA